MTPLRRRRHDARHAHKHSTTSSIQEQAVSGDAYTRWVWGGGGCMSYVASRLRTHNNSQLCLSATGTVHCGGTHENSKICALEAYRALMQHWSVLDTLHAVYNFT
jgi:hypothetical protein